MQKPMKRLMLIAVAITISLSLSAKELCRSEQTGMALNEESGIYFLSFRSGRLNLGDLKSARNFLAQMEKSCIQEDLKSTFDTGEQKFQVKKDSKGFYIQSDRMKIRQCDIEMFLVWLESRIIKDKASRIWDILTE